MDGKQVANDKCCDQNRFTRNLIMYLCFGLQNYLHEQASTQSNAPIHRNTLSQL